MRLRPAVLVLMATAALSAAALSAPVVIYRCVAADGAITIQNDAKCPKGTRESRRVVAPPAPAPAPGVIAPAPAPAPVVAMPAPVAAASAPVEATAPARLPPPPIYACLTADAQRYYSDAASATRCAPLSAVGLDGRGATDARACEVVEDRCEPVPEAERCAAWAERRTVAERALQFSPEQVDEARAELAKVEAATAGTACAR